MKGRKLVRTKSSDPPEKADYRFVDSEYRKKHKRVFRICEGKISIACGTWSTIN